jgi:lysozyme
VTFIQQLTDQLIQHEGVRLKPYRDTVGKLTIGCGRNLDDVGIWHKEAMMLLEHDIEACLGDLSQFSWFASLDEVRQRVVVDMRFQLGPTGFRGFKNTIKFIASGQYELASRAMLSSKWARQTPSRAKRLAGWMRTGVTGEAANVALPQM